MYQTVQTCTVHDASVTYLPQAVERLKDELLRTVVADQGERGRRLEEAV